MNMQHSVQITKEYNHMKSKFLASVAVLCAFSGLGWAQESKDLAVYAAMSKLEANAAEAAGGLVMVVLNGGQGDYAEAYAEDVTTFYDYLRTIEALDPSKAETVDQLRDVWGPIEDDGEDIIAEVQGGATAADLTDRVNSFWESLDGLDDTLDDALESLLADNNLTVEPTPRDDSGDTDGDAGDDTDGD